MENRGLERLKIPGGIYSVQIHEISHGFLSMKGNHTVTNAPIEFLKFRFVLGCK